MLLARLIASQFWKRATPLPLTLLKLRRSLPLPPSNSGTAPMLPWLRLLSVATSSSAPASMAPYTMPPPLQLKVSLPVLNSTWPRTVPSVMVTLSAPPLTLMLPPI
ncbi:hypothetical protein D3C71_1007530 [compost metagenome]